MWKKVSWLLVVVLFISSSFMTNTSLAAKKVKTVSTSNVSQTSTWLWNPYEFVFDEAGTVKKLVNKKVGIVYVQIDADVPMKTYASFIQKMHQNNIKVYALDGAPHWVLDSGQQLRDQFKNWLTSYQKSFSRTAKFDAIHLDVEPYALSEWTTNQNDVVTSYQKTVKEFANYSSTLNLPLELDIPFWFDEISYANNLFGNGLLSEWTIRQVTEVTLMAYRDQANQIIEIVKSEMTYAAKWNKKVRVGVETMQAAAPTESFISFYEEGEAYMYNELQKVNAYYKNSPSFSGVAIHHYASWTNMKP